MNERLTRQLLDKALLGKITFSEVIATITQRNSGMLMPSARATVSATLSLLSCTNPCSRRWQRTDGEDHIRLHKRS